jgi:hypothetical protein
VRDRGGAHGRPVESSLALHCSLLRRVGPLRT